MKGKKQTCYQELNFVRKVPSNTVTGKERFSLKYLYENELKHITVTFIKDDFIMPKLRKRNGGAILDFFSLKINDSSVLKKIKEIVPPGGENKNFLPIYCSGIFYRETENEKDRFGNRKNRRIIFH